MKLIERIVYFLTESILRSRGFSGFGLSFMSYYVSRELFQYKQIPLKKQIWALRRGFLPQSVQYYGLTNENYQDYLSDYDYAWLHPINGDFTNWLEDKVTFRYLLQPFSDYLPDYYCQVTPQGILPLVDAPDGFVADVEGLINLIRAEKELAAKLVRGMSGLGFYKLSFSEGNYYLSDVLSSEEEIRRLIQDWIHHGSEYVVIEYIHPHPNIARVWGKTPNAMRIIAIRGMDRVARIAFAYTRFGTSKTGLVDNVSAGGVFNLIDLETGSYAQGKKKIGGIVVDSPIHPDSGVLIEGRIPHWPLIKEKLIEICDHLPQLCLLGFDIAVTTKGFKILEINYHPAINNLQLFTPIYKHALLRSFFLDKLKYEKIIRETKRRHLLKSILRRVLVNPRSITGKWLWQLKMKFQQENFEELLRLVQDSEFFNEKWYLEHYPEARDSGLSPVIHYLIKGGFTGCDPGPDFDSAYYLESNVDVKRIGVNPLVHYLKYGRREGRTPKRDSRDRHQAAEARIRVPKDNRAGLI